MMLTTPMQPSVNTLMLDALTVASWKMLNLEYEMSQHIHYNCKMCPTGLCAKLMELQGEYMDAAAALHLLSGDFQ